MSTVKSNPEINDWINEINNTNDTQFEAKEEHVFGETTVRVSLIVAYSTVFICCFFGNLMVISVVIIHRRMRTATNFFLANLALADICVGIFCVYQNLLLYLTNGWALGDFLCRMYHFVHGLSYTTSILILTVISIERYIVIVHTLWGRRFITLKRLKIVLALVWSLSAVYNSPRLFVYGIVQVPSMDGQEGHATLCVLKRFNYNSKNYDLYNFVVLFAIPIVVMTVLYLIIAHRLWKSGEIFNRTPKRQNNCKRAWRSRYKVTKIETHHQTAIELSSTACNSDVRESVGGVNNQSKGSWNGKLHNGRAMGGEKEKTQNTTPFSFQLNRGKRKCNNNIVKDCTSDSQLYSIKKTREEPAKNNDPGYRVLLVRKRVIRLFVAVVVCFVVCNLPYHARKFWQNWSITYDGASQKSVFLTISTTLVFYMNSGINPFLYAFLSTNFRQCIWDILLCRKKSWGNRHLSPASTGRQYSTNNAPIVTSTQRSV